MARKSSFNSAAHGLRGVASLMVFGAHILGGTAKHIYPHNDAYVAFVQAPWSFGIYGVNLFFVISGFVIFSSVERYMPREFAVRRIVRIYPLFFAFSILFVAINAATNTDPVSNNLHSVVAGLLFLDLFAGTHQLTPNAWSLTYEMIYYALACMTFHFAIRERNYLLGGLAVAASAAFLIALPISFYFLGGVIVALLARRQCLVAHWLQRPLEILLGISCIWIASTGHVDYVWADLGDPLVAARIVATIAFFYLAVQPDSVARALLDNRFFAYFGAVSYSLYLVHPYTYYVARGLFARLHLFTDNVALSIGLFALFTVAITIPLTHLAHVFLEQMPYRKVFGQSVFHRRRPETAPASEMAPNGSYRGSTIRMRSDA